LRTIEELVAETPVLAGLSAHQMDLIAGCARNTRFSAGEMVLREGEPADTFYVLRSGTVALEIPVPGREPLVIATVGPGDTLGYSWLFEPYRWQFDARATEPVAALAFDAVCLRSKCDAYHELGYELMRRFAAGMLRRLQATRLQLMDVYGHVGSR
jgi:CRP/FNR family cyclic AMP-dependent transcriptional regulator